jgi:NIPSNAP protein
MKKTIVLSLLTILLGTAFGAETDTRCFELRTYYAAPGKLDDLHARFRDHTMKIFQNHGMSNIGYWVPLENTDNKLIYLLAFPSRDAREKAWKEFGADPEWKAAQKASEANGKLVSKVESVLLSATDYSPETKASTAAEPRTFELRTYTATPGHLENLNARFRDHTVALFQKHGMSNFGYWVPMPGQKGAGDTLIYILAHNSREAAAASFKAFGEDPDWVQARKASEEKAGGPLTVKDGVKSVFMKPTDYSPSK